MIDREYSLIPCDCEKEIQEIQISKEEMNVLIFTSGTTGSAKGVCLSQNNLLADSTMAGSRSAAPTINRRTLPPNDACTFEDIAHLINLGSLTGSAKGVCLSQNNLLADIQYTLSMVNIKKSDVTLSIRNRKELENTLCLSYQRNRTYRCWLSQKRFRKLSFHLRTPRQLWHNNTVC